MSQTFTYDDDNELLFNPGEGLEEGDLNNLQRLNRYQTWSGFIGERYLVPGQDGFTPDRPVRTLGNALQVEANNADLDIVIAAGLVAQDLGAVALPEYRRLLHNFGGQTITVDAADATNDRWDILAVKVEHLEGGAESRDFEDAVTGALSTTTPDKRRYSRLTLEYVTGTPAGSPAEPAVPAGYEKIARIMVPATATALDDDDIYDYRYPWGYNRATLNLKDGRISVGWVYSNVLADRLAASGISDDVYFPCHPQHSDGFRSAFRSNVRLSRVIISGQFAAGVLAQFWQIDYGDFAQTAVAGRDISAGIITGAGARHAISLSDNTQEPVWINGRPNPRDDVGLAGAIHDPAAVLQISSGAATDGIRGITLEWFGA